MDKRSCFPNKLKKYETGASWRRKESKNGKPQQKRRCPSLSPTRPTILLPPMQWTSNGEDGTNSAPVVSTRVQGDQVVRYASTSSSSQLVFHTTPTAPSPGEVFYNSEDQADLEFIVGAEEWRFPAHSFILSKRELTLQSLFKSAQPPAEDENRAQNNVARTLTILRLPDLQPDSFEQMLRYIYTQQVSLSSVKSALPLLHLSQAYHLSELAIQCLDYISTHLTPSKVLLVLSSLMQPCLKKENDSDGGTSTERHEHDNLQNELLLLCFQVIDCHADTILQSEDFDNLEHAVMMEIVKRDTLEASSEAIVFEAIMRWACRACKKQRRELTADNKSLVLGKALFFVRYLLMTQEEFIRGPVSQGVLSKEDKEFLLSKINGNTTLPHVPLPGHWIGWNITLKRQNRNLLTVTSPSSNVLSSGTNTSTSPTGSVAKPSTERKKKSMSKKLLNGVGDLVICVIHMLD